MVHNHLKPCHFILISMWLIRYSCGHISGHHELIPTKFCQWVLFIMLHQQMVFKMLKCKKKKKFGAIVEYSLQYHTAARLEFKSCLQTLGLGQQLGQRVWAVSRSCPKFFCDVITSVLYNTPNLSLMAADTITQGRQNSGLETLWINSPSANRKFSHISMTGKFCSGKVNNTPNTITAYKTKTIALSDGRFHNMTCCIQVPQWRYPRIPMVDKIQVTMAMVVTRRYGKYRLFSPMLDSMGII